MIDTGMIRKWWAVFKNSNELTEIRVLEGQHSYSGYFTDVEKIIAAIAPYDNMPHAQIYFTLNRIADACYARAQHDKIIPAFRDPTTGDGDVVERTFVLIDLDPCRPAGVSASHEELEYAHLKAVAIYRFLLAQGFYEPVICKSGNGYHVIIPCRMPAGDKSTAVVKQFLQTLSVLFSDEYVGVDEKVFNASRICKLYGVTAKKGVNTEQRPWRQSEIVRVPDEIKPTDIAYFQKVNALLPEEQPTPSRWNGYQAERFDLEQFLMKHGVRYRAEGAGAVASYCPCAKALPLPRYMRAESAALRERKPLKPIYKARGATASPPEKKARGATAYTIN